MATLQERVSLLATRIGTECKTLHSQLGTLTNLTTTQKESLVLALNEVNAAVTSLTTTVGTNTSNVSAITGRVEAAESAIESLQSAVEGALKIDDTTASTTTVYSSSKVESVVTASAQQVKDDLLNGAGTAYDTLKELGDLIKTNQDAIASLESIAAGHVRFDQAQTLTDEQKTQARTNIGAASATDVTANADAIAALEEVVDGLSSGTATDLTQIKQDITDIKAKDTEQDTAITTLQGTAHSHSNKTVLDGITAAKVSAWDKAGTDATSALANAATAQSAAEAAQSDVDTLSANVGPTDTDYVAAFEAALSA